MKRSILVPLKPAVFVVQAILGHGRKPEKLRNESGR